ncbi:BSD domain-containing protein [Aphelenchoides besseyi]|nr:BSD domain-containing protein [Aphelenchoides besseyi]KAI6199255.1 BSD domain-containing protein [Aphelenchoides besseyi]
MADKSEPTIPSETKVTEKETNEPVEDLKDEPEDPPTPAATLPSPGQWFNSYFGGEWMAKAKEQTLNTLESVKKDLDEFSDTVSKEASAIASASQKAVKQQAEILQQFVSTPTGPETPQTEKSAQSSDFGLGWMKSVVDTVKSLTIEDTAKNEDNFTEPVRVGTRNSTLEHFQLLEYQNNENTFTQPPTQNLEMYKDWLKEFKVSEYNGEINLLLSNNPKLREIYAKIVPLKVDNYTFWNRYFFKIFVAEMERELRLTKGKVFEQLNVETNVKSKSDEKKGETALSPAATDNESWSICSSGGDDLQELPDEIESLDSQQLAAGPLTPKAEDSPTEEDWEKYEKEKKSESSKGSSADHQ